MIKLNILMLLLVFASGNNKAPSLAEVRVLYNAAVYEEDKCRELIKMLDSYNPETHPVLVGYKASATMIMAKHVFNPIAKLKYFNRGKDLLEETIAIYPKNAELTMLRFLAQSKIPKFLGYNSHLEEDRSFLFSTIPEIENRTLKNYILSTLVASGEVKAEIENLKHNKRK